MTDYNSMTRDDLRRECKRRQMTRYSSQKKHELVKRLEADDTKKLPTMTGDFHIHIADQITLDINQRQARNARKAHRRKLRRQGFSAGFSA